MGTGSPFPGAKARSGRDSNHSPPSSVEVKNEQKLSPTPPWRVAGQKKRDRVIRPNSGQH